MALKIRRTGERSPVYDLHVADNHTFVADGHIVHNCTEILEVTSSGDKLKMSREQIAALTKDDMIKDNIRVVGFDHKTDQFEVIKGMETAVCNLGSINLSRGYVKAGKLDKVKLRKNVAIAVKYLDRVIDRNFYPIPEAESSNDRWRPIGLGLMGLADFFFQIGLPFGSDEAIKLSGEIQEEIYYQALVTSNELAKEHGPHRDFDLTRAAKGELQFDLAGVEVADKERWDDLKASIMEHGLRNSLVIAIAPTATISHIVGAEECIEPIKFNLMKRETLSGEFISINKYLVRDLKKLGLWDERMRSLLTRENGSVQNLPVPDEIKELYKTVWEISQKDIIAHAVARGAFIDQSQSLNLFLDLTKHAPDKRIGVVSKLYMHAWEMGCKTTYYLRTRSGSQIEKVTINSQSSAPAAAPENPDICESCT